MNLSNSSLHYGLKAKRSLARIGILFLILAFSDASSQTSSFDFNDENFLVPPRPNVTTCPDCVGQVFLRMSEPSVENDMISINISLKVEVPDTLTVPEGFEAIPYLGNYTFYFGKDGDTPGIDFSTGCKFEPVAPLLPTDVRVVKNNRDPRAPVAILGNAPLNGSTAPSDGSHYTLSTTSFKDFAKFSCPIPNDNKGEVDGFILAPFADVYLFSIQVPVNQAGGGVGGGQLRLLLRADNSYQYYPLNGDDPFEFAGTVNDDGTVVTLDITNNLPGVTPTVTASYSAADVGEPTSGCGAPTSSPVVDGNQVTVTFSESQADNDCTVTFTVTLPDGSSYSYDQVVGTSGNPAEQLERAQGRFISGSLVEYSAYLVGKINRTDGGQVAPGNFATAQIEAVAAMAMTRADVPDTYTGEQVQDLLNTAVAGALPPEWASTLLTSAYSFTGSVPEGGSSSPVDFVIDLSNDPLTTTARLVKLLRDGSWSGVDNSDMDGSVSYLPGGGSSPCPSGPLLGWFSTASTERDGVIPGIAPVGCVRISIVDNGIYDADVTMENPEGLVGTISDPVVALAENANIPLAHDSSPGGGGGNGFLGIGSAGAWTIMALLTVLGLSMLRRRRVTVRSEL